MNIKNSLLVNVASLGFFFFALNACVKNIDLPIHFKKQPVVVGILNPDSLISLQLTYSLAPNDTSSYEPIKKADVSFFENGQLIDQLSISENGVYGLRRKPIVGQKYSISIKVAGFDEITATDSVPARPILRLYRYDATSNPNQNPDMELHVLNTKIMGTGSIWFGVYSKQERLEVLQAGSPLPGQESKFAKWHYGFRQLSMLSNNQNLDRFNSIFDGLSGKYAFGDPARIDTDLIRLDPKPIIKFTFIGQIVPKFKDTSFLYGFMASATYNRYLKSAINAYQSRLLNSNGDLNNPFAEPTPVYTNIKNGLGIWASYSGVKISF